MTKIIKFKSRNKERKTIGVASISIRNPRDVLSRYGFSKDIAYSDGILGIDGTVLIPIEGPEYGLLALSTTKSDAIYVLKDIAKFADCRNMPV